MLLMRTVDGLAVRVDAGVAKLLRKNAAGVRLVARSYTLTMVRMVRVVRMVRRGA